MPDLPHRPRTRPGLAVLVRGPGQLQLGIDPRHAVVIDGLSDLAMTELRTLDGRHTVAELGEKAPELIDILERLDAAGLLDRPRLAPCIAVVGSGDLASAITSLVGHARDPDLTILTSRAPERVRHLMAARQPHLAVQVREGAGVIGPLVLPGRTSCLTCVDLHLTDRDAHWPSIVTQLAALPDHADPVTTTATAAFAVAQAMVAFTSERPPTWNATIELHPASGLAETRSWYPHPDCQCAAHNMAK